MQDSVERDSFQQKGVQKDRKFWAQIWFGKLAKFHQITSVQDWELTRVHVIAFLRHHRDKGTPTWKRLKIAQAIIYYQESIRGKKAGSLYWVTGQLRQAADRERIAAQGGPSMEGVVGRIPKHEPDVIQSMRRKMRLLGKKFNTEKAYIRWVKRFRRAFQLEKQADFQRVGRAEVESFLTDLAVDGQVGASS